MIHTLNKVYKHERTAMWVLQDAVHNITNKVTVPAEGIISVTKPDSIEASAYVNETISGVHHVHVKAGDTVYFKLKNTAVAPTTVTFDFMGTTSSIEVPAATEDSLIISTTDEGTLVIKEDSMTPAETINLFANPMGGAGGGAMGTGLGAGLVGGILGTALLGRGGLGGAVDGGVATAANVESVVNNTAILQGIGDLKAAVPLAEAQVQLALAGAQMDINSNLSSNTASTIAAVGAGNASVMNNLNMQTLMNTKGFSDSVAAAVAAGTLSVSATKDAAILAERTAWALTQVVTNDGDKTRALIQSIDKTNDSRALVSLANEISDLKNSRNLDAATGNITISNNNTAVATAQQQQAQQQQQLQYQILAQLGILNNDIQSVKQNSVVFNSGTQTNSGNQAAANTRVA